MTNLKNTNPTAKKEHRCEWCGGKINKGERYDYKVGTFDGDFFTIKSHIDCDKLIYKLDMFEHSEDGIDSCIFWEYIFNEFKSLSEKQNLCINRFDNYEKEAKYLKLNFVKENHLKLEV